MATIATTRARRLRRRQSPPEGRLWSHLRDRQVIGAKFRRQHPLAGYVLDFYCEELRLCIEVDGGEHAERVAADERRTAELAMLRVLVVRFWNNDVMGNTDGVLRHVQEVIEQRRREMAKQPSPREEGGA